MPLNPPVFFPNIGYRWVCDRCGERYHEDNMHECTNCEGDICPSCGSFPCLPGRTANEFWCDGCAEGWRKKHGPARAAFIEPMECMAVDAIPDGIEWTYEIKFDGYRIEAVKTAGNVRLYSRRNKDFTGRFSAIADELRAIPDNTVIDGEVVALDDKGNPNFGLLQTGHKAILTYFVFDLLMRDGADLTRLPLNERRHKLQGIVAGLKHVRVSEVSGSLNPMFAFVRSRGLEGIVAKKLYGIYQPGLRTGLWAKQRINTQQEFVIGGYVSGGNGIDSIVIGIYKENALHYVARVRAGFVPASRRKVFDEIKGLKTAKCPFVNLPEKTAGRWGEGLTAEKMKKCIWVKPETVAQIEFLEWTPGDKLRHTKFVRLRDDKNPLQVVRET